MNATNSNGKGETMIAFTCYSEHTFIAGFDRRALAAANRWINEQRRENPSVTLRSRITADRKAGGYYVTVEEV
jgi:hypothetical protein